MEKILVPTDFSENANNAAKYAIHFAHTTGKAIVFFNVTHKDIPTSSAHDIYLKKVAEDVNKASLALHVLVEKMYVELHLVMPPRRTFFDVQFGHNVQDEIVEAAEKHKVTMIIMGTLGASGFKKIFFGSNTVGVLKNVHCPVLAIPDKVKYAEIAHIGYSSNLQDLDTEVKQLLPIVKTFKASLDIFNVHPVYPSYFDYAKFNAEERLTELKKEFRYKKMTLTLINRPKENDLKGGVDYFIKTHKPDLLIMFSQSRDWFERLTNPSATEEMALNPKLPLLSFKV
jgi:nucleotide-binding universal stress UspA family protein